MSAQGVDLPNLIKLNSVVAALRMRGFFFTACTVSSANATASTILGYSRVQEGIRPAKDKLERRRQERSSKNGTHLRRGGGSSPRQTKVASECGPVRSLGRGLNQIDGRVLSRSILSSRKTI